MKKTIALFTALLFTATGAMAASPTLTPRVTPAPTTANQQQIDDLKERLATKVAELRQTTNQAISGTVKNSTVSTLTVETPTREVKLELNDDITVFQIVSGRRTALDIDDVDTNDFVVVFGEHDATLDILTAKTIFIQAVPPTQIQGTVVDVDRADNTILVQTLENRNITVDIERTTVTNVWDTEGGIVKAGFSRVVTGDSVHVTGTADADEDNRISAIRILDIGNVSGAPTQAVSPTPEKDTTPTPTRRATATPRPSPSPEP